MTGGTAPENTDLDGSLRELSALLWRERIALDRLADGLAGVSAELGEHVTDVDTAGLYHSISALELHRAIAAREAAIDLGVGGEPTLEQLVEAAPPGWADALASHRRALIDLTTEVGHLVRRPVVDIREGDGDGEGEPGFPIAAVRRFGVQRSLRDFLS